MKINIGFGKKGIEVTSDADKYDEDVADQLKDDEKKWCDDLLNIVEHSSEVSRSDVKILQVSDDYVTAQLFDYDWMRFHFGKKSKWFSMAIPKDDQDDELFEDVKNKNQLMWRMDLSGAEDFMDYYDVICDRFYEIIDNH